MGEYAEMMLDGTCCSCCGELLGDWENPAGYAMTCPSCADDLDDEPAAKTPRTETTWGCGECGRDFGSRNALGQHIRAKHSPKQRSWATHGPELLRAAEAARKKLREVCEDCFGEYHDSDGLDDAIAACKEIGGDGNG